MIEKYMEKLQDDYSWYTSNISSSGMAMSLELASFMYLLCDKFKFRTLMDRGSGFGSFVLRKYAGEQDFPVEVFSIDDNAEWLKKTKEYLHMKWLDSDNLFLWDDFLNLISPTFDFILEDASTNLRVQTTNEMISLLKEDGIVLFDDCHYAVTHVPIIKKHKIEQEMFEYDIKELTIDSYTRFGTFLTRKDIDWLEKI